MTMNDMTSRLKQRVNHAITEAYYRGVGWRIITTAGGLDIPARVGLFPQGCGVVGVSVPSDILLAVMDDPYDGVYSQRIVRLDTGDKYSTLSGTF